MFSPVLTFPTLQQISIDIPNIRKDWADFYECCELIYHLSWRQVGHSAFGDWQQQLLIKAPLKVNRVLCPI